MGLQNGTTAFPKMLPMVQKCDPAVLLLGIYPRGRKAYVYTKTCAQMFLVALFVIAKYWKQPKCPRTGEWRKEVWPIHAVEYYSATKRKELLLCVKIQAKNEHIPCDSTYIKLWKVKMNHSDGKQIADCLAMRRRGEKREGMAKGRRKLQEW